MLRKSTLLLTLLCVAALATGIVAEQLYQQIDPITNPQSIIRQMSRAACSMVKTNLTASSYYSGYDAGYGTYTYYDPAVECGAGPYTYAITDFSFTLYDDGAAGLTWPTTLDIVIYDIAPAGACPGLGTELCRITVTPDRALFEYPNAGTAVFATPCCVDGPVYIGVEYPATTVTPVASLLFDDDAAVNHCENWMWVPGSGYFNWTDFWTPPPPGWPIFMVGGETNATACAPTTDCPVWADGDLFKSENPPQLPDESGWDVNATYPKVLADDFMCGETGYIKDIHFWGSWLDGNPGTVNSFILSFHTDIPASQSPTGHSMPGELLWERVITVFTETPIIGNDLEGWYDPYTGDILADNHQEYMQYDVCLNNQDWFPQEQGTIYWLNVSANVEPSSDGIERLWGWKSTQDHWNDDAVYFDCLSNSTCVVPDNGNGTADLPPDCPMIPIQLEQMTLQGNLPPGTTIKFDPQFLNFVNTNEVPGGSLGGTIVTADFTAELTVTGTGALGFFSRFMNMPMSMEYHTSPRNPSDATQSIDIELIQLQGEIFGDPDFCTLRI